MQRGPAPRLRYASFPPRLVARSAIAKALRAGTPAKIGFFSVLTATVDSRFVKTERGDETEEVLAALGGSTRLGATRSATSSTN